MIRLAEFFPGLSHHVTLLDGNCFFDCMKKTGLFPGDDVQQIRSKVVDFLARNSDGPLCGGGKNSFCNWSLEFLGTDMSLRCLALHSASDILPEKDRGDNEDQLFRAYLEKMCCDGVYADTVCFNIVPMVCF